MFALPAPNSFIPTSFPLQRQHSPTPPPRQLDSYDQLPLSASYFDIIATEETMTAILAQAQHTPPVHQHQQQPHPSAPSHLAQGKQHSSSAVPQTAGATAPYGDVDAEIEFLHDSAPTKKGELFFYSYKVPEGQVQTTVEGQARPVRVHDLRSLSDEERRQGGYTTDQAGFEVVEGFGDASTREEWYAQQWEDESYLTGKYYADVDVLLKRRFGATSTFIFDHTFRKRDPTADDADPNQRQPVNRAHIDQSVWAGLERIRLHLGEEMYERVKAVLGREDGGNAAGEDKGLNVKLVNVWRPLRDNSDNDWPLAVGDFRTFSDEDLVVAELRYPDRTGETLAIRYKPTQRFHYLSGHRADEALLLKCWDSKDGTKTPHTAFPHPGGSAPGEAKDKEKLKPRWSIEVRCLVVTDPRAQKA